MLALAIVSTVMALVRLLLATRFSTAFILAPEEGVALRVLTLSLPVYNTSFGR